jgi:hypothetical protein
MLLILRLAGVLANHTTVRSGRRSLFKKLFDRADIVRDVTFSPQRFAADAD